MSETHLEFKIYKMIKGGGENFFPIQVLLGIPRIRLEDRMADTSMTHKPTLNPATSQAGKAGCGPYVKDEPSPHWQLPLASDLS